MRTSSDRRHRAPIAVVLAASAALGSWAFGGRLPAVDAAQQASDAALPGGLEIVQVRPNFSFIAGAGGNIAVQVGDDGVVVVDTGSAASTAAVLVAIKRISSKPIRYIINTSPDRDHVGGNAALAQAGEALFGRATFSGVVQTGQKAPAPIVAAEGVVLHMSTASASTPAWPEPAWPNEAFHYPRKVMYLNGEAVEVLLQPAAHTDSDSIVFFRRSDVIVAGDVLDTRHFPVIDVTRGGTIQGEIAALNTLSDLAVSSVPIVTREEGTLIVSGHGRLYDQLDVVEYRDMVTIVHDRVRDLVAAGRSLADVKAAQPAKGYVGRYGNAGGDWTTDHFVEAIYRSLAKEKR
jgi:glyoxylase-like metal-dependent hydrolase (beta-lactamase superfamily II)